MVRELKLGQLLLQQKLIFLFKDGSSAMKHGEVFTDYKVDFRVRNHEVDETMRIMYKQR